jgi:protease-4
MFKRLRIPNPLRFFRWLWFAFRNWRRGSARLDYITFTLPAQIPALPEPRSWIQKRVLGAPGLSLTELERIFQRIGDDPRPQGVILHLRGFAMSLADLQTLRGIILRLRAKGKRVICFAQGYSNAAYYIASAADEIVLQPGGEVETIGLRSEASFFKDALDVLGVRLDSVAISPYKGFFDSFTRSEASPEGREQLEWLLDSRYQQIVEGIAEGRRTSAEAVRAMIDAAPHLDRDALAKGYVEAVETEEDLYRRLNPEHVLTWKEADKKVRLKWRKASEKYVALLRVSGTMVQGESMNPPVDIPVPFVGGERAGDLTVVRQVRNLMKNKRAAAVVLFIDSGGGAAAAAEAMTAALDELAKDRPLVVFMNGVAASGGYYIATPAHWIVAQPGTITGSIGVLTAKPITEGLFEKLRVHRLELTRGANADLMSDMQPFTETQRLRIRQSIEHIYQQFIERVARGRRLSLEAIDAVSGGRVWTGAQAKAYGLVDELGDLYTALAKARELASLPDHAPLAMVGGKSSPLPPQLAQAANPASALEYLYTGVQAVCNGRPQLLLPFIWKGD